MEDIARQINNRLRRFNALFTSVVTVIDLASPPANPVIQESQQRWSISFNSQDNTAISGTYFNPIIGGTIGPAFDIPSKIYTLKFDDWPIEVMSAWNLTVGGFGGGNLVIVETLIRG